MRTTRAARTRAMNSGVVAAGVFLVVLLVVVLVVLLVVFFVVAGAVFWCCRRTGGGACWAVVEVREDVARVLFLLRVGRRDDDGGRRRHSRGKTRGHEDGVGADDDGVLRRRFGLWRSLLLRADHLLPERVRLEGNAELHGLDGHAVLGLRELDRGHSDQSLFDFGRLRLDLLLRLRRLEHLRRLLLGCCVVAVLLLLERLLLRRGGGCGGLDLLLRELLPLRHLRERQLLLDRELLLEHRHLARMQLRQHVRRDPRRRRRHQLLLLQLEQLLLLLRAQLRLLRRLEVRLLLCLAALLLGGLAVALPFGRTLLFRGFFRLALLGRRRRRLFAAFLRRSSSWCLRRLPPRARFPRRRPLRRGLRQLAVRARGVFLLRRRLLRLVFLLVVLFFVLVLFVVVVEVRQGAQREDLDVSQRSGQR
mmetsp:Transcript_18821/g.57906  ORF Transcript_18821/g.57906 Transcript_18821/m.57906 type:complete len:420 (-) Transcript_18821:296-1555(-)